MVSTVKSRPNHYDVLGLSPTATQAEIAAAFARSMSMFGARPVAVAAHIGVAFEVLRDPAKRRAYDRSLGLIPEEQPQAQWTFVRQSWGPMIASASRSGPTAAEPHVTAPAQPEAPAGPKVDLFAAPALRAALPRQPTGLDDVIADILRTGHDEKARLRDAGSRRRDWNRPLFVVAGLFVAAGSVGAVAGLSVTHNEESAVAEPAVTVGLPQVHQQASADPASAKPLAAPGDAQPASPAPKYFSKTRAERTVAPQQVAPASPASITESEADGAVQDPLAPQPAAAQPVPASLPLPNSVIARTIERIGYRCGEVASTAAAAASGVFTVTCSSGQTYQATPVHGRYRFRRSGGR